MAFYGTWPPIERFANTPVIIASNILKNDILYWYPAGILALVDYANIRLNSLWQIYVLSGNSQPYVVITRGIWFAQYAGFDDFLAFLCGINGSSPVVLNYTGQNCEISSLTGADLNLPSITVALLNQSRAVTRTVTNIASDETYSVSWSAPFGVSVSVAPTRFFIAGGQKQNLTVVLNATMNSTSASFGKIGLYGSQGHRSMVPLSVISKITYNTTMSWERIWQ